MQVKFDHIFTFAVKIDLMWCNIVSNKKYVDESHKHLNVLKLLIGENEYLK